MPRFSHDDPEYEAGLREMSLRLNRLMDDRGWSRADLTRAASKFMPEGGRFGPDNTSNFVDGKRRPTKPFVIAMCKAFGVEEDAFLPPYLLDRPGEAAPSRPLSYTGAGQASSMSRLYRPGASDQAGGEDIRGTRTRERG
jgi:hypothetical protein